MTKMQIQIRSGKCDLMSCEEERCLTVTNGSSKVRLKMELTGSTEFSLRRAHPASHDQNYHQMNWMTTVNSHASSSATWHRPWRCKNMTKI